MTQVLHIQPLTRIEGHASIAIHLDDNGNVAETMLQISSLRGFEKFIQGRPAEEVPRIVSRICGICPWMHHLASVKAVDGCFGATPPLAGRLLRETCLSLAHISDKILHFFFLAAPDFLIGPEQDYSVRNVMGLVRANPRLAQKVVEMRQLGQMMLERFSGKAIHPIAGVPGGFAKPMLEADRKALLHDARTLLDFARYAFDLAREEIFTPHMETFASLGTITTGFLGTVDRQGGLQLYDGSLRLVHPGGRTIDFPAEEYTGYIREHVPAWSHGKMPYASGWNEGFSMDLEDPRGIYRANTLARLNVCDHIPTPGAQALLEEFRSLFGRPAQATLLYHWARLIELLHACERTVELLQHPELCNPDIRKKCRPGPGRGVGHVEAPRGTLIHDYTTDDNGCIVSANLIVGTTHNIAPMNMSVRQAAMSAIRGGAYDEQLLNRVEMAVRAYDP